MLPLPYRVLRYALESLYANLSRADVGDILDQYEYDVTDEQFTEIEDMLKAALKEPNEIRLPYVFRDLSMCSGELPATLVLDGSDIWMGFEGHGAFDMEPGRGLPVYIEYYEGRLRVCLYDDVNQGDCQIIDMQGAREGERVDEAEVG